MESQYRLVRVTEKGDWESYHAIRRVELFEAKGRHGVYDSGRPEEIAPENHPLLLKYQGCPVGTTRLDIREEYAIVRLVAITRQEQGKGHGRVLSDLVDDYARNAGVRTLYVNAAPEALGYYKALGWKNYSWDPSELCGIASACIQMRKDLTSPEGQTF